MGTATGLVKKRVSAESESPLAFLLATETLGPIQ